MQLSTMFPPGAPMERDDLYGAPGAGPFGPEPVALPQPASLASAGPFGMAAQPGPQPQAVHDRMKLMVPALVAAFGPRFGARGTAALLTGLMRGRDAKLAQQEQVEQTQRRRALEAAEFRKNATDELLSSQTVEELEAKLEGMQGMADYHGVDLHSAMRQAAGVVETRQGEVATAKQRASAEKVITHNDQTNPGQWSAPDETGTMRSREWWVQRAGAPGLLPGKAKRQTTTVSGVGLVDSETGEVITPTKEKESTPQVGSFEDFVIQKYGPRPTPEQITKARQEYQNADNDPLLNEMREMRIELMKRQSNAPDLSPAQFNMANKLADDFARDSKDFVQRGQSYGTVLAAAKDPSAAGDLSLIFAYMKMLDPGSVVREGEFATAQNAASVPDRIRNAYNRIVSGERLNPTMRTDFVNQAKAVYGASKQRQDAIVRTYTQRAQVARVPVDLVVMDYGAGVEAPAAVPPPAPGKIRARDPQGNIHEAAAGTALPAGWKLEP